MKGLAEIVIALCDLLEAEGQLLQRKVLQTLRMGAALLLGLLLGSIAVIFLVAAAYQALTAYLHPGWALMILSVCCAAAAGGLVWVSLPKKPKHTP